MNARALVFNNVQLNTKDIIDATVYANDIHGLTDVSVLSMLQRGTQTIQSTLNPALAGRCLDDTITHYTFDKHRMGQDECPHLTKISHC